MTKLYFRHSYVYEDTLAKLVGENFAWSDYEKTQKFCEDFSKYWDQYNDKIFNYYKKLGLTLPEFWIAYPVHSRKGLVPFSDPITFFIKDDFEEVTTVLIHEMCHVFLVVGQNMKISNKLWEEVSKKYPNENFNTVAHLLVNLMAKGGVEHVFGKERARELLAPERSMEGLKEAWEIIDSKPELLEEENPIEAIQKL